MPLSGGMPCGAPPSYRLQLQSALGTGNQGGSISYPRLVAQVVLLGGRLVSVMQLVAKEAVVAVDSLRLQQQKIGQHIRLHAHIRLASAWVFAGKESGQLEPTMRVTVLLPE